MSDSTISVGSRVQLHLRGKDHVGDVVAASRSRVTVRYTDPYGDERVVKVPAESALAVDEDAA